MNEERPITRRGFLDWIIRLCSFVGGAAMTIPGLMYLWPAARGGAAESAVEVNDALGLAIGEAITIQVGSKAVIVVRHRLGFKAFSAACTHLGCLVQWDRGQREFTCPCHAAIFDADGKVVSGPPPAPLPEYKVRELEDKVIVSAV